MSYSLKPSVKNPSFNDLIHFKITIDVVYLLKAGVHDVLNRNRITFVIEKNLAFLYIHITHNNHNMTQIVIRTKHRRRMTRI